MAFRGERDRRDPVPRGTATFELALGGARVRVADLPAPWDPFVVRQYAPFAERPRPGRPPDLEIRCRQGEERVVVPLPPPGGTIVLGIEREGPRRFRIRSHWQDGWIDLDGGRGELELTTRPWNLFSISLENFLRVAFQLLVIEREMFLLHAAAVLDGGRVHLFFGPSGAGKSTVTAFSAPRHALSDDMVLVDVSGDVPLARAVPFYMLFPPEERLRGAWPIAGAWRLRQAPEDRAEPLSPARAVATVSASVPYVHELGVPHEGLTRLVARLCTRVPVHDLHFTKSDRFWRTVGSAI